MKMKMTSNIIYIIIKTQSRQKAQEGKVIVFQKKRYELQTCINLFEQINDHTRIMHKIQFRSSFKTINLFQISHQTYLIKHDIYITLGKKEFSSRKISHLEASTERCSEILEHKKFRKFLSK